MKRTWMYVIDAVRPPVRNTLYDEINEEILNSTSDLRANVSEILNRVEIRFSIQDDINLTLDKS